MQKEAVRAWDPVYGYSDARSGACNVVSEGSSRSNGNQSGCHLCSGKHSIANCKDFIKMTPTQRLNVARDKRCVFFCV